MPNLACQLIIFGQRNRDEFANCVQAVAEVGYAGIETGPHPQGAEYLLAVARKNNVEVAGVHYGFDLVKNVDENVKFMQGCRAKYVMCSGVGDYKTRGLAAYDEAAQVFNTIGKEYAEAGITFCYHNHSWEFQVYDRGVKAMYRLLADTDPATVKLCVDTYWILHGGEDPVGFLRRHLGRVAYMHFKDMAPEAHPKECGTFVEVGRGVVDFPRVVRVLEGADIEWYTVEQDRTPGDPKESCRISREYIRNQLGI